MSSNENRTDRNRAIGLPKRMYSNEDIVKILAKLEELGYNIDELEALTIEEADKLSQGITN